MKKIISIILASLTVFALSACAASSKVDVTDSTELLSSVWSLYDDSEVFPVLGGDYENQTDGTPGTVGLSDPTVADSILGLPVDQAELIDNAASVVHAMNANTFTAGAYKLKDASDQQQFAVALKENLMDRQWMCGFPDKLVILSVGDEYVISAFGEATNVETFKEKVTEAFEMAKVMHEEAFEK